MRASHLGCMQNSPISIIMTIIIAGFVRLACAQGPYNGTIAANQRGTTHTHPLGGYGPNDLLRIRFTASSANPLTTTSLMVNFDAPKQPNDINLQDFYHKNPDDIDSYDLDAMWEARDQFINVYRPAGAANLYLTVFNFDPSYRQASVHYNIDIDPPGQVVFSCDSCSNSQSYQSSTSCFCTGCSFEKEGKICSRLVQKLQKNISFNLSPQTYQYFALEDTQKVTVTVNVQGGTAEAYFQFEQFDGEVANYYNVAKGSSDGRYLINNNDLKVGADTKKRKLLITLVSFANTPIKAELSFAVESTVSVLVIVMAVLGSILFVILVVAVICIIKKRNANNQVNSELNLPSETSKLTGEEIERYFPACLYSQLQNQPKVDHQSSLNPMPAQQNQGAAADQDCVICLEQIKSQDQVRIGYCKHIFHGACLISWFKKQRNCPYCRKEYNRDETVAEYNKLVSENENRVLKSTELAKAIFNRKGLSKTYIENLQ